MNRTKILVLGALMAAIAAIFQSLPIFLSEAFIILTVFSALPIYLASRQHPLSGSLSFVSAALLIFLFSTHEAIFFLCTNGIVGLSLGVSRYYKLRSIPTILIGTAALSLTLCILNYGVGIPVFGTEIPGFLISQVAVICLVALVYNLIYYFFTEFVYKRLKKAGFTEDSRNK